MSTQIESIRSESTAARIRAGRAASLYREGMPVVDAAVAKLAPRYGALVTADELRALGLQGLVSAARRYRPGTGVEFRQYAYFRVVGAMLDGVRIAARDARHVKLHVEANEEVEGVARESCRGPESRLDRGARRSAVTAAIADLSPRHRRIVELVYRDGMQLRDAARALRMSYAGVRRHHQRLLQRLRTRLEGSRPAMRRRVAA